MAKYNNYNIIICDKKFKVKKQENVIYIKELYKKIDSQFKRKFSFTRSGVRNIKRPALKNIKIIEKDHIAFVILKNVKKLIKI